MQKVAEIKESQWADRKKQIEADTQITIEASRKAVEEATSEAKTELKSLQTQLKSAKKQFDVERSKQHKKALELEEAIAELEHLQKVLSLTNANLQDENRILESDIVVRNQTVSELKAVEESLSTNIAELNVQQGQAEDKVAALTLDIKSKSDELDVLKADAKTKIEQLNTDISILEQRKQNLAQEIVRNRAEDEAVRDNLASWSKKLDERDRNLRIREAKVGEQEKAIARNYDLLNL